MGILHHKKDNSTKAILVFPGMSPEQVGQQKQTITTCGGEILSVHCDKGTLIGYRVRCGFSEPETLAFFQKLVAALPNGAFKVEKHWI